MEYARTTNKKGKKMNPIITELASELLDETPDNCNLFISNLHKHCQYSAINVKYEDRNRNLKLSESIYNRMKNSNNSK